MEVGHVGHFGWKWLCEDLSDKSPHHGATQEQTVNQTPSRMSEWMSEFLEDSFRQRSGSWRWRSWETYYMTRRIKSCVSELDENTVPKRDQIKAWLQWVDFPTDRETPRATKEILTTKGPEWHMISSNKQRERRGSLPPTTTVFKTSMSTNCTLG